MSSGAGGSNSIVKKEVSKDILLSDFEIKKSLLEVLADVGATSKFYNFPEVVRLLVLYIDKYELYIPQVSAYVNCEKNPLSAVLGVPNFHIKDLSLMVAKNLRLVREYSGGNSPNNCAENISPHVTTCSTSVCSNNIAVTITSDSRGVSETSSACSSINSTNNLRLEVSNDSGASAASVNESGDNKNSVNIDGLIINKSNCDISSSEINEKTAHKPTHLFEIPKIPESSLSETESVHSYQEYVTDVHHSTSESDCESDVIQFEFEEYEPVDSDEDDDNLKEQSDCESEIEDLSLAVVTLATLWQKGDEEFFGDIDSSEESGMEDFELSSEEDVELANERWCCLSCGKQNKAFFRYCLKCWKLRKNWLPDRPKKMKRQKDLLKRRKTDGESSVENTPKKTPEEIVNKMKDTIDTNNDSSDLSGIDEVDDDDEMTTGESQEICSQDSGVYSLTDSQEMLIGSQNIEGLDEVDSNETKSKLPIKSNFENECASTSGYGKVVDNIDIKCFRMKRSFDEFDDNYTNKKLKLDNTADDLRGRDKVLTLKPKKIWLNTTEGKKWLQTFNQLKRSLIAESSDETDEDDSSSMCTICCVMPKNASIIHGKISHQATCYSCARKLFNSKKRCPVCRRKIHMVTKHIVV